MPVMKIRTKDLQAALADHLPVLNRNIHAVSTLSNALVTVGEGTIHLSSTDRYIIACTRLQPRGEVTDPRKHQGILTTRELKLMRSYLQHMAGDNITVRITETHFTINPDVDSPLALRLKEPGNYPNLLPLLREAMSDEAIHSATAAPKSYNPALISHIRGVELWATGESGKASTFSNERGTFGIIMPLGKRVDEKAKELRYSNADILMETENA